MLIRAPRQRPLNHQRGMDDMRRLLLGDVDLPGRLSGLACGLLLGYATH